MSSTGTCWLLQEIQKAGKGVAIEFEPYIENNVIKSAIVEHTDGNALIYYPIREPGNDDGGIEYTPLSFTDKIKIVSDGYNTKN